ncbi:TIR domain-containing protein [Thermocoleostomius sinensis]|uniref:TIR domain-containing protein n=1 Tax=Thermocoleostomius sinensis A174 TaxID=2016057 RepID=A0A9E8Z9E2_9CYAN|nr:TIR domain-containing protein [Thermocoleostomius sinensis]WAL58731.1 TIR domain-containing protein [Thermocoleostomius sinensis A174]
MSEIFEPIYSPRENDIFISYSPHDDFVAKRLEKAIIKLSRDPWIDTQDLPPGLKSDMPESWTYIESGIKNADVFVFIISPKSIDSKRNQAELELAIQYQKRLVPVLYQPVEPDLIPDVFRARDITWIVIDSIELDDLTEKFEDIAKNILHIHIHQRLLDRVIEWYEGERKSDFLLYGADLESVKQWFDQNKERKPYLTPLQRRYLDESIRASGKHLNPEQPDIFVSYSRKDRKFVEALCARLRVAGLNLWVDWENIPVAADWRQEIQEGIEKAHTFLLVISPDSIASPYCQDEVTRAVNNNKRIIAVVWRRNYDRERFNHVPALATIKRYNWLYCDTFEKIGTTVSNLIRAVNTDLDYVKAHTRLLLQAIEWKNQDRKEELLLRKTELVSAQQLLLKGRTIEQQWRQEGKFEKLPPIPLPTPLQQEFIDESVRAETELTRLERNRQARIRALLAAMLFFLGLATLAVAGQFKALNREIEVLVSSLEGVRELDALVNGLRAGQELERWGWAIERLEPDLRVRVVTALQQQTYTLRERNRLVGHHAQVYNVTHSPDGQLIASASEDGTVRLWTQRGELIQSLDQAPMPGQSAAVVQVLFNPGIEQDVYTLASAGDGGTINLWKIRHTDTGWQAALAQTLNVFAEQDSAKTSRIFSLSFSQGGQVLAASAGSNVTIWRRNETGQFQYLSSLQHAPDRTVLNVSFSQFSQRGQKLASADSEGTIKVLTSQDLFDTYQVTELQHGSRVLQVSFSPDGKMLASAGDADPVVKLWNPAQSSTPIQRLEGHEAGIYRIAFNPDGSKLASASEDGSVRLWSQTNANWASQPSSIGLRGHLGSVYRVQFSPDGQTIATAGDDDTIKLWMWDGTLLDSLEGHEDEVLSIEFSNDGHMLISSSKDKTVRLWNVDSPVRVLPHTNRVFDASFTADGRILASSGQGTIRLWRTDDGTPLLTEPIKQPGSIESLSFAPHHAMDGNGQLLAAADQDGSIKFWQLQRTTTGYAVRSAGSIHQAHKSKVRSLAFNPDGSLLATAGNDGTVKLWQLTTDGKTYRGTIAKALLTQDPTYSVSFSADGQMLAAGGQAGIVRVWKIQPTGDSLAVNLAHSLQEHTGPVYSVSFSPNGQVLASASQDNTVKLWNLSGILVTAKTLQGHRDEVLKVDFSPNEQLLASASRDDSIKLWTIDGNLVTTLNGHRREVSSVKFSPQGDTLASTSHDARVLLWQLTDNFDLPQFLAEGCDLANDYLTTSQHDPTAIQSNQLSNALSEVRRYCRRLQPDQTEPVTTMSLRSPEG